MPSENVYDMVHCRGEEFSTTRRQEVVTRLQHFLLDHACLSAFLLLESVVFLSKLYRKGHMQQSDGVVGSDKYLLCPADLKNMALSELLSIRSH